MSWNYSMKESLNKNKNDLLPMSRTNLAFNAWKIKSVNLMAPNQSKYLDLKRMWSRQPEQKYIGKAPLKKRS
jgi:hypothetical protein